MQNFDSLVMMHVSSGCINQQSDFKTNIPGHDTTFKLKQKSPENSQ